MAKTEAELDREIAEAGKNELLLQAIDRAVLGGRMKIEAAKDAYALYHSSCLVDADTLQITLDGLPLDDALAKIIKGRPLWQPSGPDPRVVAREALEAEVLAGSVSAHGRAFKQWGKDEYEKFIAKHAAKPGERAKDKADDKGTDHATNPFHKSNWNVTKQAALLRAVGSEKCAQIAASVGSKIGATHPNPNF